MSVFSTATMRIKTFGLIGCILFFCAGYSQAQPVRESNTPISMHYAKIMNDFIEYIVPELSSEKDLVKISRGYFEDLGYRVIRIEIRSKDEQRILASWKIPNSKLAVPPRMFCYLSDIGSHVMMNDQGDEYVQIQNYDWDGNVPGPEPIGVSVGLTHKWE